MKQDPRELTFRHFQGNDDFELMHAILLGSGKADGIVENATVAGIQRWCNPSSRFDPHKDILFAQLQSPDGEGSPVGFSRTSWYTGKDGLGVYYQDSFLNSEGRNRGIWPAIIAENDKRLMDIATHHNHIKLHSFQAWATEAQKDWIAALESEGYQAVRHFHNMVRKLDNIPERQLPNGLEIRPVRQNHFRRIWEAQREVQTELFEFVAENWTDDKYTDWLANPTHTPDLWQVAWDGDQVVGMVLTKIIKTENQSIGSKRGYTEHIFVSKPWRKRGLASALIARSLQVLRNHGMEEAELGVDSENESQAFGLYKRMGYQTYSIDIWFRKPLDLINQ
jgi:ribosomal protein S18 acetylase RimI-like enzyme